MEKNERKPADFSPLIVQDYSVFNMFKIWYKTKVGIARLFSDGFSIIRLAIFGLSDDRQ